MAIPALPFLVGVAAGVAVTLAIRRWSGRPVAERRYSPEFEQAKPLQVDAEPVEDTVGLEARLSS